MATVDRRPQESNSNIIVLEGCVDTRPKPLVPADADVRSFPGIMLDVERLMSSELWALSTGTEFKAAVALWCGHGSKCQLGRFQMMKRCSRGSLTTLGDGAKIGRWPYEASFCARTEGFTIKLYAKM
jgi:hypothetical protein